MLEFELAKGSFISRYGAAKIVVPLRDIVLPVVKYEFNLDKHLLGLPEIDIAFLDLVKEGKSEDDIIQGLINRYLPIRFFKVRQFARQEIVIGFIGHRGSGKTCGMVSVGLFDFLLRGKSVWSNVPIEVKVSYLGASRVYRSFPLEQVDLLDLKEGYRGGALLCDEANMQVGEASRSMSSANLDFSYTIQQCRKRKLSVLWTAQNWMSIDNRLRFQSDFVIGCRDSAQAGYNKEVGHYSEWRNYDVGGQSGVLDLEYESTHRYIHQFEVWRGTHWNRPIWNAYDTGLLQSGDYISQYKQLRSGKAKELTQGLVDERTRPAREYVEMLLTQGIQAFRAVSLWQELGITEDFVQQRLIGKALKEYYDRKRDDSGYFYELKTQEAI